jgi:hypothetical protein
VARWNGYTWSALGSGISGPEHPTVWSLALDGRGNLYAGGFFPTAGNKGSSHFALWHGEAVLAVPWAPPSPAGFALQAAAPNPFTLSTTLSFDLPREVDVRLEVLDVSGRRVRTLLAAPQSAGRHSVTWDGADDHGRRAVPGVYHLRMQAGSFAAARRLVRVP